MIQCVFQIHSHHKQIPTARFLMSMIGFIFWVWIYLLSEILYCYLGHRSPKVRHTNSQHNPNGQHCSAVQLVTELHWRRLLEHLVLPLPQNSSLVSIKALRLTRLKSWVGMASPETIKRRVTINLARADCIETDSDLTFRWPKSWIDYSF